MDDTIDRFDAMREAWNRLALATGDPFLSHEWLSSWWRAYGGGAARAATLVGDDGELRSGAVLVRSGTRRLDAAASVYSSTWDVVAADERSRLDLWRHLAAAAGPRFSVPRLPASSASGAMARAALEADGYRVAVSRHPWRPRILLPDTWEDMLAALSGNSRSQVRKKRRRIERQGDVAFRIGDRETLEDDLEVFFRLEASGWKGASGTALLHDPRAVRLYTDFARAAARRGWLRLCILELDGVAIAADYGCVLGDASFVLKTCFDERYARLSPGAVLRAESIRRAIDEGLSVFEWLGSPDAYKLHWGGSVDEVLTLEAYRGLGLAPFVARHRVRPAAARALRAIRGR